MMAYVSAMSVSICLLIVGSDCRISSMSELGAYVSEREVKRFATSDALAATSVGRMALEDGGAAACGAGAGGRPKHTPGVPARNKRAPKPMDERLFAMRSSRWLI
jgi:hypothetical protein